jgi:hypothetical protein
MKNDDLLEEAWQLLENSIVEYKGRPIGTLAAEDKSLSLLNYNQIFMRDFAVSAFAFLLDGRHEIVKNFLEVTVSMQSRVSQMDCFLPAKGTMPASFKVSHASSGEKLIPDYGEKAIARVAPIDSVFWWLYILRAYVKKTNDWDYAHSDDCQQSIKSILELTLTNRFDMFPTMLVPDGSFMIDRRMGVYGYPLEIQGLFCTALLSAKELLIQDNANKIYFENINRRLGHLIYHIRKYYWLDFKKLNQIYRFQIEEYKEHALNQFNIFPESIPAWVFNWLSDDDGYFAGNVGPSRMDFRFFTAGNLLMIINSLADQKQADAILTLLHNHEKELMGEMPLKICFPALKGKEWRMITGHDPKNTAWSYHNGGSWPSIMWYLAAASVKTGRTGHLSEMIELAERRLSRDNYPEYYDGIHNKLIGKEARKRQTWSIAGYIIAKTLLNEPLKSEILTFDESPEILSCAENSCKELDY